jgi:hypothetical protein
MPRTVDGLMQVLSAYNDNCETVDYSLLSHGQRVDHCITKNQQEWIINMYHTIVYHYAETANNIRAASNAGTLHRYIVSVFTVAQSKRARAANAIGAGEWSNLTTIVNDYAFPIDAFVIYKAQLRGGLYIASPYKKDSDKSVMILRDGSVMTNIN